jgi:hypothetical protein
MLHQPLASKVFRGDSEDMVDRLIEACQEARAPVASGYTGFGRALEPASAWLCDETAPVPCATTRGTAASSPNLKKGSNNNSVSNSKKFPQGSHKHARSSPSKSSSMPSSPEHKRGGSMCAQPGRATKTAATNGALAKPAAPATSNAFACPAIAASPKPEAVPMPTSSLLTRALRARSPSPDKAIDCGARLLQQLQAVRA